MLGVSRLAGPAHQARHVAGAQEALKGNDTAAIKSAIEKLSEESQALGQAIYANAAAESPNGESAAADSDPDVVDAEVVDDADSKENK